MSSLICPMAIQQMTYAGASGAGALPIVPCLCRLSGQQQVLEEKGREVIAAIQSRLSVHGERLLADGSFARMPELGDGFVAQPLHLK